MDYVNRLVGCQKAVASDDSAPAAPIASPAIVAAPSGPVIAPANPVARRIMLEEAIQGADGFELSILIGNVMSRLEELRREAKLPVKELVG